MRELKLFLILYDGEQYHIEAASMSEAIRIWHEHMKAENGDDWYGDEEPETCALVHGKPVLRQLSTPAEANT